MYESQKKEELERCQFLMYVGIVLQGIVMNLISPQVQGIQVVSEKNIQFSFFIAKKVTKAQQQHSCGQKHNFPVYKKIFI